METVQYYALMTCAVVLGFSWLVFVHELGHYLLAKWNGVRVHVFSIGMGPYIFSFTRGETLYVLSLVPIGGYVKMAGQDDLRPDLKPTKDPRDYRNKRPGQRAAILAAGAAFNLLFAYLGFAVCYYFGVEMPAPIVGKVDPKSPAGQAKAYAGTGREPVPNPLQEGDRITMVNGQPIKTFFELAMAVGSAGADRDIYIQYERKNEFGKGELARTPAVVRTERDKAAGVSSAGIDKYQEKVDYPVGFTCREEVYVLKFPEADDAADRKPTPAQTAGLQAGDRMVSIDGKPITLMTDLFESVKRSDGKSINVVVERDGKEIEYPITPEFNEKDKRYLVGIVPIANPVDQIDPRCEAYKEGLREGAFLLGIRESRKKDELTIIYIESADKDVGKDNKKIKIPLPTASASSLVLVQRKDAVEMVGAGSVGEAFGMAWADTLGHSTMVFIVLHRLITGEVDVKNMAGPVGMAGILTKVADERSLTYYLWFLALLSLNLGVLQFVPIPLLDGWHLLMISVEKLKGSPVSLKVQEAFQYVGLFLILCLLVLVTKNDIMRFFN